MRAANVLVVALLTSLGLALPSNTYPYTAPQLVDKIKTDITPLAQLIEESAKGVTADSALYPLQVNPYLKVNGGFESALVEIAAILPLLGKSGPYYGLDAKNLKDALDGYFLKVDDVAKILIDTVPVVEGLVVPGSLPFAGVPFTKTLQAFIDSTLGFSKAAQAKLPPPLAKEVYESSGKAVASLEAALHKYAPIFHV